MPPGSIFAKIDESVLSPSIRLRNAYQSSMPDGVVPSDS